METTNHTALKHFLKISDMETALYGATKLSPEFRADLEAEIASPNPKSLAEVTAPHAKFIASMYAGCAN